ncbi:uncharacterized protein LOC143018049 isoform X1 [Oratosquilla oratoria]|uniref:uncharacterized protein LOC143018049 isoform X1 n=1 Tax=Oratosquilla oratoria TaxID=337810 RepID=UPI003F758732
MVNESGTCGDEMEVGKDEEPSLEDYRRIGDQLAKPFTDLGVVYISNHGIPEEEIGKAIRTALHFFSLPKSTKMKYLRLPGSKCGYVEVGKEKVDLKGLLTEMYEAFNCTTRGDGAWPDDELPHLRKNMNSFFDICRQLSIRIMRCMSATLGVDIDYFSKYHSFRPETNESYLSFIHYPPVPLKEEVTRMGAHTDYHTFTFLFLDDVRGLQIKDRQGEWLDVVSIPGAILINIADLMKCWTGDTWRAVPHRVVLPNDEVRQQRRLSMAFFAKPDNNIILESVCGTNRYAVNVTEHVKRKVAELKKSD